MREEMSLIALPLTLTFLSCLASVLSKNSGFDPRSYEKHVAVCSAVQRNVEPIKHVDINIGYIDSNPSNSKETIIMVHGWPSLWSSWSNQILEFEKTHRVIALDQRGFGASTHPDDVQSSGNMPDLVGDLVCVLENAGVQGEVICMGHDWGTQVCYEAARMRPDIFTSVVGTIPYIPYAGPFIEVPSLTALLPKLSYQAFFEQNTSLAVAELDKDKRRTLRATLRDVATPPPDVFLTREDTFLGGWDGVKDIPPVHFFSPEEEDYFVEQYEIQGFRNTLQFYTRGNRYDAWKFAQDQGNFTVPARSLSILPLNDPVADWLKATELLHSAQFVPDLTIETVEAAHWVQLEQPEIVNGIIRRWLEVKQLKQDVSSSGGKDVRDEL